MPQTKLEIHQKSLEMCYREIKSQEADESEFNRKVGYEGGSQTLRAREKRGAMLCHKGYYSSSERRKERSKRRVKRMKMDTKQTNKQTTTTKTKPKLC